MQKICWNCNGTSEEDTFQQETTIVEHEKAKDNIRDLRQWVYHDKYRLLPQ